MPRTAFGRWLREPLVGFLLVGLLLFVAYDRLDQTGQRDDPRTRIEFTPDDLRQIELAWIAQGREAPSPEQLRNLVDARVHEEILYREALALGLDQDDTIVRRRLAQKMEFLFEDVAALREPTPEELAAWYEGHRAQFTVPARASFRHLYFSPDRRGAHAREAASDALAAISGEAKDGADPETLGDPFMFQDYYPDRSTDDVARDFGPGFARALFALSPGSWSGPLESGYGWHLVIVEDTTPAHVPELAAIEPDLRREWIEAQRFELRGRAFEAMRSRYEVVLPSDPEMREVTDPGASAPERPESSR